MKPNSRMLWGAAALATFGLVMASSGLTMAVLALLLPLERSVAHVAVFDSDAGIDWTPLAFAVIFELFAIAFMAQVLIRRPLASKQSLSLGSPLVSVGMIGVFGAMIAILFTWQIRLVWVRIEGDLMGGSKYANPASALTSIAGMCGMSSLLFGLLSNLMLARWWQLSNAFGIPVAESANEAPSVA